MVGFVFELLVEGGEIWLGLVFDLLVEGGEIGWVRRRDWLGFVFDLLVEGAEIGWVLFLIFWWKAERLVGFCF